MVLSGFGPDYKLNTPGGRLNTKIQQNQRNVRISGVEVFHIEGITIPNFEVYTLRLYLQ